MRAPPPPPTRAVRFADVALAPGEARAARFVLPARRVATRERDAVPVWVVAGAQPGPRVTVLAALRGYEATAARVARALAASLVPATVAGTVVVVPVARPGGRFTAAGRPVARTAMWRFPGAPDGPRRARDAAAVFSELVLGAAAVLVLTEPEPGRAGIAALRASERDRRAWKLAREAGAAAFLRPERRADSLVGAAAKAGVPAIELCIDAPGNGDGLANAVTSVRRLLAAAGVLAGEPRPDTGPGRRRSILLPRADSVRAPMGGLVENLARPGAFVARGEALARIVAAVGDAEATVIAPRDGVVIEATTRAGVKRNAKLFTLGRLPSARSATRAPPPAPARPPRDATVTVGWVERVSLPALGVKNLPAKIDTGARTSALHVATMRLVPAAAAASPRRPILEVTLPAGAGRSAPRATPVRVSVRDYVDVKDTGGRTERRPVIETTLRLGAVERRVRVTLTDRGDMLYPMLIGRTALGPNILVDPTRRRLLTNRR